MKLFYSYINNVIVDITNIYIYSNLSIAFRTSIVLIKVDSNFVWVLKIAIMINNNLDCCISIKNGSHFYNPIII